MSGAWAVFYREMLILRGRLGRQLANYAVSPLLYAIAFGWGMGRGVRMEGVDYLTYMLPGLMAMSSMNRAFGMASEINIARFYWHTFEEYQTAPVAAASIALGEVCAAMVRATLAAGVVAVLAAVSGVDLRLGPTLLAAVLANGFIFGAAAVWAAMVVRTHADQANLTGFIITPMSFLCGTFFSPEAMPPWAATIIGVLPLTQASDCIRAAALGLPTPWLAWAAMGLYCAAFFGLAVLYVRRASI